MFGVTTMAALGPVLLVIAAIAALIAIGYLIVKNWDTIKAAGKAVWDFMKNAWDAILGFIQTAFDWIKQNWPLLLAILTGPFGLAVLAIQRNYDTIRDAIATAINWVKENWPLLLAIITGPIGLAVLAITRNFDTIKEAFGAVYTWIKEKVEAIAGIITGVVSGIQHAIGSVVGAIKAPINAVIRAWNDLEFKIPEVKVGPVTFGGQTIGLPNLPTLAQGGIVKRTGLAVVHEGERFSGVNGAGGFGVGNTYKLNVSVGPGTDPARVGRTVVDYIKAFERSNGTDWRTGARA